LLRNVSSANNMSRTGLNTEGGGASNAMIGSFGNSNNNSLSSSANLHSLLQSMNNNGGSTSMSSLLGGNNAASAASLANLLSRTESSSTGLSALRNQDGLSNRNTTSVEDFLSLVAAGDIPHQDPAMLNLPLSQLQQQQQQQLQNGGNTSKGGQQGGGANNVQAAANSVLSNALASRASGGNLGSLNDGSAGNLSKLGSTAELLQQLVEASNNNNSGDNMKRKLLDVDGSLDSQGVSKR